MRAISQITALIDTYISENERRTTGKNPERARLFEDLKTNIETAAASTDTIERTILNIRNLIIATAKANNAIKDGDKSKTALKNMYEFASEALPFAAVESALEGEYGRLLAEEADAAAQVFQTKATVLKDVSARLARDAAELTRNPIEKINKAIKNKTLANLDPSAVITALERLTVDELRTTAASTPTKSVFYRELRMELFNRQLPVSEGIFYLLMQSPLAARYGELLKAQAETKDEASGRALRTMIESIGEIIRICLSNQETALQDLQALFAVKNEMALLAMLDVMQGKHMITVQPTPLLDTHASLHYRFVQSASALLSDMQPDTVAHLDMPRVSADLRSLSGLQRRDSVTATRVEDGAAASAGNSNDALMRTLQTLHYCVTLSNVVSNLTEELTVSAESVVGGIQARGLGASAEEMGAASALLMPEYRFLAALKVKMEALQRDIQASFERLNAIEEQQKQEHSTQTDLIYQGAIKQLIDSVVEWENTFAGTASDKKAVLAALGGELTDDPIVALDIATRMGAVAVREAAETALKKAIAANITTVQNALEGFKTNNIGLPVALPVQVRPTGALSLRFIAGLANLYRDGKKDFDAVISLVRILHQQDLLTPSVQARLLHQSNNVDGLLSLQTFLNASHIHVDSKQLRRLWNALDHNAPNFELLTPLQARFGLNAETMIAMIENLSGTWKRSLAMLTTMFGDEKSTPEALMQLIHASKGNNELIAKVFLMYEAIKVNQSHLLTEFFQPAMMDKVIHTIATQALRFTNEMVMRLKASAVGAMLGLSENLDHIIDRTVQMLARNLSYHYALKMHDERSRDARLSSDAVMFDELVGMLMSGFHELARYDGAHQVNVRPTQEVGLDKPKIVDTAPIQWTHAVAAAERFVVDHDQLERDMERDLQSNMNVSPEQRMYLDLMTLAMGMMQKNGLLVVDSADRPTVAVRVNASKEVMSSYLFYVVTGLTDRVEALSRTPSVQRVDPAAIVTAVMSAAEESVRAELEDATVLSRRSSSPAMFRVPGGADRGSRSLSVSTTDEDAAANQGGLDASSTLTVRSTSPH